MTAAPSARAIQIGILLVIGASLTFGAQMIVQLIGAIHFAAYGIMARIAARHDSAETSFFWTSIIVAAGMSLVVPLVWRHLQGDN